MRVKTINSKQSNKENKERQKERSTVIKKDVKKNVECNFFNILYWYMSAVVFILPKLFLEISQCLDMLYIGTICKDIDWLQLRLYTIDLGNKT